MRYSEIHVKISSLGHMKMDIKSKKCVSGKDLVD